MTNMKTVPEVKDSYNFTIGTFYLVGILVFLPMHFFSTSTDYWMYKFRPPHHPPRPDHHPDDHGPRKVTDNVNDENYDIPKNRNFYQSHITASLAYCHILSMTISSFLLFLFKHKLPSPQARIKTSLITSIGFYLAIALFSVVVQEQNLKIYFTVVILLSVFMNLSSAIIFISLYELVVHFPISYYAAITSGQVISGILSSLIQIISLSLRVPPNICGAIYLAVGSVTIVGATIIYWYIHRNSKYFIYRIGQREIVQETHKRIWPEKRYLISAVIKLKLIYGTYIIVAGTSALIFPGFCVLISAVEKNTPLATDWERVFFVPVITFFGFQFFNLLGREASRCIVIPKNWLFVMAAAILRTGLVPLLLFCNAQPRRHLPVIFGDDAYIVIIFLFGFTEGLLINLSFMAIPTVVDEKEVEIAVVLVPVIQFLTTLIFSSLNFVFIFLV